MVVDMGESHFLDGEMGDRSWDIDAVLHLYCIWMCHYTVL